jgi:hypothetical protein
MSAHRSGVLSPSTLAGRTGHGIRIAVVDTGIHAGHPHIGNVTGGTAFNEAGEEHADVVDRLGHGTAVAAAIHEKAPAASLLAVKVFDRTLATTGRALAAAIRWAVAREVDLINLSLGTANVEHRSLMTEVVSEATVAGALIVAAAPDEQRQWLPGALPGVVAVDVDWSCPRDACAVVAHERGSLRLRASGFPRPIPGVPPERNLKGQSFAVANATGLIALAIEGRKVRSVDSLVERLARR